LLKDLKIAEFLEIVSSAEPVPGGGSAAALSAALAASLTEMVANLTIGRKEYRAVENEMKDIADAAASFRTKMMDNIDNDAEAYQNVLAAFKLPKNEAAEKKHRSRVIQESFKNAARVPMEVARDALKIMDLAHRVVAQGNKNAVTDGAVGALAARTAALAALYNVKINLDSIKDPALVEEFTEEVENLESRVIEKEKEILEHIKIQH
jgi:formiminotetrahydrofolate cyclodeaminase